MNKKFGAAGVRMRMKIENNTPDGELSGKSIRAHPN